MNAPTGSELDMLRAKAQADHRALRDRISHVSDDAIDLILRDARSHVPRRVKDRLEHSTESRRL